MEKANNVHNPDFSYGEKNDFGMKGKKKVQKKNVPLTSIRKVMNYVIPSSFFFLPPFSFFYICLIVLYDYRDLPWNALYAKQ